MPDLVGAEPISRRLIREALGVALSAAMPSAYAVYDHQKRVTGGVSPVVRILTNGSERPAKTGSGIMSRFYYSIQIWTLYGDSSIDNWSEEEAEDLADTLEHELISWMTANHNLSGEGLWTQIKYREGVPSDLRNVKIGSEVWLVEDVAIEVHVHG